MCKCVKKTYNNFCIHFTVSKQKLHVVDVFSFLSYSVGWKLYVGVLKHMLTPAESWKNQPVLMLGECSNRFYFNM